MDPAAPIVPPSLPSEEEVTGLLRGVIDPELGSDIVDLGMAKGVRVADDGLVTVTVALTTAGCPCGPRSRRTSSPASSRCPASPRSRSTGPR